MRRRGRCIDLRQQFVCHRDQGLVDAYEITLADRHPDAGEAGLLRREIGHPDFCPQRGVDFPAHLVNASAAALSGVGGLNSDSVRLSDLARALDGECKLESAGRPPDGHHPTRASAHGLGNPLKRASSVMIYNEKDRQTQDSPRQRS